MLTCRAGLRAQRPALCAVSAFDNRPRFRQARFAACLPYPAVTSVLNISCYKFVPLPDAAELRERLHAQAVAAGLKGTILLAEEGINIQMISTSEIKTSVVIDEKYMELAVRTLHKAFELEQAVGSK